MRCLKCGNRIEEGAVFCDHCLNIMKTRPVAPDTPALIPRREFTHAVKKAKKPERKPEEQIAHLQKSRRRLIRWIVVLWMVVILLIGCIYHLHRRKVQTGQNYQTQATVQVTLPR